jgi:hypothetical protein
VRAAHATKVFVGFYNFWLEERTRLPFCAADISVMNRGPSARTCLSYAVRKLSIEGASEFSRRPIHNRNINDKKTKNKKQRGGLAFFGYFFGEAKK